jgi:glycosyltransferase involved in cell wall biosynthesis
VTDVGEAKRILGRGGIVVPKKDANALAQGLLTFVHNTENSRKLIGKIARTRIIQNYTIDNVQQQYNNLYKNIIRVI